MRFAHTTLGCVSLILLLLSGCTTQRAYYAGQEWQRNQCNKLVDPNERERCLSKTDMSYEDYKRETDAAKQDR